MNFFKSLISLSALALMYSCGGVTPALVTTQPNAKGVTVAPFEQDLGSMIKFSKRFTTDRTLLLSDNSFISVRTVKASPHPIAPENLIIERYDDNLSIVWATPLNLQPGEIYEKIIPNGNSINLIVLKKESNSSFSFNIGGAKVGGNSRVQVLCRTYDALTGKLAGEKELIPMQDWSDEHNLIFRSSPDSSKVAINIVESDEPLIRLHIFDKNMTPHGMIEHKNAFDEDNDEFPQDIAISDNGTVYVVGLHENTLDVTQYSATQLKKGQRATIDVAKALSFNDDNIVQSIQVKQQHQNNNLHILLQYGQDTRVSGVSIFDYNPVDEKIVMWNDYFITPDVSLKLIGQNAPDGYSINNAFFGENGERTVVLEKKRLDEFKRATTQTTTKMGATPQQTQVTSETRFESQGAAYLYETLIALQFNSEGKLKWAKAIPRKRAQGQYSNASGLHSTDETSAITSLLGRTLYIAYRDRTSENMQGFALHKISTDNGQLSSVNLPFAMQNTGYGVFFLRDMSLWTPDGKLIIFTKEAIEKDNSGKVLKLDLNQL